MTDRYYDIFETPQGWVGVLASDRGLRRTTLPEPTIEACWDKLGDEIDAAEPAPERFVNLRDKIGRFLDGENVDFGDQPMDVDDAPPFLRAAWEACRTIPVGETRPYKWLAAEAGRPAAPRAAGQAMARNRLPFLIPCHRVIASDGSLGGYGTGKTRLDLKKRLLDMESRLLVTTI
jgi:methylated-DNA-[protein]-cysteine S-methyltransferase